MIPEVDLCLRTARGGGNLLWNYTLEAGRDVASNCCVKVEGKILHDSRRPFKRQ